MRSGGKRDHAFLFGGLALILALAGCSQVPTYKDYDAFIKRPMPPAGGKAYVIEPPDQIRIVAPNAPEIHNETQLLRPDGYITLYLLGDIFVAGKTPTQVGAEIQERIDEYYQDARVQVQVVGFNSKVYYMAGETPGAGPRPYTGQDTVLDAVLRAGVPRSAWPEKAIVLRPSEDPELIRRMSVNLRDFWEKGDLKYNVLLEEGDIIYIPINPLAAIGTAVSNLLAPVDPVISAVGAPARASAAVSTAGVVR